MSQNLQNLSDFIFARTTSSVTDVDLLLTGVHQENTRIFNRVALLKALVVCSVSTGGYVQINPQLGCLPALIGSDARPVYLYEFVEALDGLIDYASVKEEFPTLSYAQINGAIAFIRKIAQTNAKGIDIDALEDEDDANDVELMKAIRSALNSGEASRVLNNG